MANATQIDMLFLDTVRNIIDEEASLKEQPFDVDELAYAKSMGFSDAAIARLWETTEDEIAQIRSKNNIRPVYKMIDTCASEFESYIPLFYATYEDENESRVSARKKILVLRTGPIRVARAWSSTIPRSTPSGPSRKAATRPSSSTIIRRPVSYGLHHRRQAVLRASDRGGCDERHRSGKAGGSHCLPGRPDGH